jgi:hypothetical protein
MHTIDPLRVDAFKRLLAQPDPSDLPRRGHVYRCEGDPNRRATRLPGILMAWLERRILENNADEPLASAADPATGRDGLSTPNRWLAKAPGLGQVDGRQSP